MAGVALGVGGFDYIAVGVVIVGDAFLLCVAFQPLIFVEKPGIMPFVRGNHVLFKAIVILWTPFRTAFSSVKRFPVIHWRTTIRPRDLSSCYPRSIME